MWPSLIVGILLSSTTALAAPSGAQLWAKADAPRKAQLLQAYREFFGEATAQEKLGEWETRRAAHGLWPVTAAWAEVPARMNCVFAGWPSVRSGSCSSPARSNPAYSRGSCAANQLHCQPMLFGEGLCADMSTSAQRSIAFAQCEAKFAQAGRSLATIVDEIVRGGHETELTDLLAFADRICASGAQASSGMCRKLEAKVAQIRAALQERPATTNLTNNEDTQLLADVTRFLDSRLTLLNPLEGLQGNCVLRRDLVLTADAANPLLLRADPDAGALAADSSATTALVNDDTDASTDAAVPGDTTSTLGARVPAEDTAAPLAAPATALFTPSDFIAAANSGPLEYVGRGTINLRGNVDSCAFQNAQAVVLYMPCNRVGGRVSFKVISKSGGTLDVSVDPRQGGVASPSIIALVPSQAMSGALSFNQIKSEVEGGDQDSRCVRTPLVTRCLGNLAPRQSDWDTASADFVGRAGAGWSNLIGQTDRNLAVPNR